MRILLLFVSILIFNGCKPTKDGFISSGSLIKDLIIRYPQLGVDHNNQSLSYNLKRHIKDHDWNAEFELHRAEGYNSQIIVLRKDNEAYAIPLFGSDQADYWQRDSLAQAYVKNKVNTTFQQELKIANKKLNLSRVDFFYIRYIFQHVLLLGESLTDPCVDKLEMPYELRYKGSYTFIISVHSKDSLSIRSEPIITM